MIVIPIQKVEAEILKNIASHFVMREGTDYGAVETPFEEKVNQVLSQLHKGEALLTFDLASESMNIVYAKDAKHLVENYEIPTENQEPRQESRQESLIKAQARKSHQRYEDEDQS